jgi:hypothetical protein
MLTHKTQYTINQAYHLVVAWLVNYTSTTSTTFQTAIEPANGNGTVIILPYAKTTYYLINHTDANGLTASNVSNGYVYFSNGASTPIVSETTYEYPNPKSYVGYYQSPPYSAYYFESYSSFADNPAYTWTYTAGSYLYFYLEVVDLIIPYYMVYADELIADEHKENWGLFTTVYNPYPTPSGNTYGTSSYLLQENIINFIPMS